ncbi:MAG: hypothetical protein QOF02_3662 [Blastocatellia bacterium]|jgi:hypothetical protein|nr:hypothetical protein [Blastocatellia bacterium]
MNKQTSSLRRKRKVALESNAVTHKASNSIAPKDSNFVAANTDKETETINSDLEEYKLANAVQENLYSVATKSITIFIAITAVSLGFVFRESVSQQLKIIFCGFNIAMSLFFVIGFGGFFIITRRVARRMDRLGEKLSFSLPHHNALSYGIFLTLLSGIVVLIFWIATIVLRFWVQGTANQTTSNRNSWLDWYDLL